MDDHEFFKLPRLYIDTPLTGGEDAVLSADQAHYFKTVLRRQDGDRIRLFNGRDGEFLCTLCDLGKKSGLAAADRLLRAQPDAGPDTHLYFAPIKKSRMDWLIEKAVELGVTHLHPVVTQNTEVRDVNVKRLRQQIVEAAEQCERLTIPALDEPIKFDALPRDIPLLACLERGDRTPLRNAIVPAQPVFFLIGPEGGFTVEESTRIRQNQTWHPVSLGPNILRCETAVCVALSAMIPLP